MRVSGYFSILEKLPQIRYDQHNDNVLTFKIKHLSGRDLFLCEIEMNINDVSIWIFFHFGKMASK